MKDKVLAAVLAAFAFYYFIWPDSLESCAHKAAKEAITNYGFSVLLEMCKEPTWVDYVKDKLFTPMQAPKGMKPFTGDLDQAPKEAAMDKFLDGK